MVLFDRLRTDPVYNTRAVVQSTGVPADTFRAWERRYGVPHPRRTRGNQRLYSERDVATINWLRDRTREGLTISQAIAMYRAEAGERDPVSIADALDAAGAARHYLAVDDSRLLAFREQIMLALIAFDAASADQVVEEALAFLPVEDVCLHVLQEVLIEIGERWARGEVSISSEHYASHFVMRKLGTLFNLSRPDSGRGPLVAACVEGELHEVGLLLTSLFLSRRGYRIVYLGANLPVHDLIETVKRVRPVLVLLSASTPEGVKHLEGATSAVQDLTMSHPLTRSPINVGYGGWIFSQEPHLRDRIHGLYLGQDAAVATETIDTLLSDSPTPLTNGARDHTRGET